MAICEHCNKAYEAKRASSRYCSDKCRVSANRVSVTNDGLSVTVSVTDVSVTDNIADILAGMHNPGTRTVALSDGQQWSPDLRTSQVMDSYASGTSHQRTLHALYSQYCISEVHHANTY